MDKIILSHDDSGATVAVMRHYSFDFVRQSFAIHGWQMLDAYAMDWHQGWSYAPTSNRLVVDAETQRVLGLETPYVDPDDCTLRKLVRTPKKIADWLQGGSFDPDFTAEMEFGVWQEYVASSDEWVGDELTLADFEAYIARMPEPEPTLEELKRQLAGLTDPATVRVNILRGAIVLPPEYVSKTDEGGEYSELRAENAELRDTLSSLLDVQNGAPLFKYEQQWQAAVDAARALLSKPQP